MFKNHLKIAWRNIVNRKFYTFLNICGLALAVSCCIFIYLYNNYNLSFDNYHKQSERTFRVVNQLHLDKTEYNPGTTYATYRFLKNNVSQVETAAFCIRDQSFIVNIPGDNPKRFKEDNSVSFADTDWFRIFSFHWLKGDPAQLNKPGNVVLSKKQASKYFGNDDAIGKVININGYALTVSGIIADGPYNTDIHSDIYVSFKSIYEIEPGYKTDKYFQSNWGNISTRYTGFVVLKKIADQVAVDRQLDAEKKKQFGKDHKYFSYSLLSLKENHFDTRYLGVVQKSLLWNLGVIGLLIISIAVINYINMVVAQQSARAVEIGTRKVLGGSSTQIFMQFIVEALLTSVIAIVIACLLVLALLPVANSWLFLDAPLHIISGLNLALYIVGLLAMIIIGTGAYPAFLLSRVTVAQALKNNVLNMPAGIGRKILVVFQNVVTQGLIVCTLIIVMQVYYLKNTDMGFDRDQVITIPTGEAPSASQQYQMTQALKQMPGVRSVSFCLNTPSGDSHRGGTVQFNNHEWEKWPARFAIGDASYQQTFGLKIIEGRNIRDKKHEFLINKTMADMLRSSHKEIIIGKKLIAGGGPGDGEGVIVGIVKDFNVNSLVGKIEPSVMLEDSSQHRVMAVKLTGKNTPATVDQLQKLYQQVLPDQVFSYQFVDEQIARLYQKESVQQKLIWVAAGIAITISSLGLLGLISLVAIQRTKEIGIRKILGATVGQICLMLSNDLARLLLLSFAIATPLSFYLMHKWLQSFAYHINISWWMFGIAGATAIVIAMLSMGFRAIKAATVNPVRSLRSE